MIWRLAYHSFIGLVIVLLSFWTNIQDSFCHGKSPRHTFQVLNVLVFFFGVVLYLFLVFAGFVSSRLVSWHVSMLRPYDFPALLSATNNTLYIYIRRISTHMKLLVSTFPKLAHLILSRNRVVGCEDLLLPLSNVHGATWQQKVERWRQRNETTV